MDADADDPEPGAPVHRTPFYGLWPRWAADDEAEWADAKDAASAGARADA
ncbi:hypothetical protein [Longimicrobium sp.]|nr:hypothetical protein [Longimicrobium sp.]HEX6038809.1 hypothetical protein [Longimicrobium sp.]